MKFHLTCAVIVLFASCRSYQKSPYKLQLEQENIAAFEQSLLAGVEPYFPEHIAILPTNYRPKDLVECSRWYPTRINRLFAPSSEDLDALYLNFRHLEVIKSVECCYTGANVTLDRYAFQVLGLVIRQKRYLYLNAISLRVLQTRDGSIGDQLQTSLIRHCDGNINFWGVLFNLEDHRFYHLAINGT